MKVFDRGVIFLIRLVLSVFGRRKRDRVLATISSPLAPIIDINAEDRTIRVVCNSRKALYWTRHFFSHEPDTIEWIRSFTPGDVFWDVGANVGIYSLFAAVNSGARVVSFEPMTESYANLQRNIWLNDQSDNIDSFCIALSGSKSVSRLCLDNPDAGSDSHEFIKHDTGRRDAGISQTVLSLSIDEFIEEYSPYFPNHLKIDVDGPELEILQGATRTLRDSRLRSVLIEGDVQATDKNHAMNSLLENTGFVKAQQGTTAGSERHCNYLYKRTSI